MSPRLTAPPPEAPCAPIHATAVAHWGDGLPYVREHYLAAIRRELRRTVEACVLIGRRLLVMKAMEAHGQWLTCLRQLDVEERTAQRLMEAARRLSRLPSSRSTEVLPAIGSQGKLFELLTLPKAQFDALTEGEAVAGVALDDIAQMTVRELRTALRDARAQGQAKDHASQDKERHIERLHRDLNDARHAWDKATPDARLTHLRAQVQGAAAEVRSALCAQGPNVASVRHYAESLLQHAAVCGAEQRTFLAGVLAELEHAVDQLRSELDLPTLCRTDSTPIVRHLMGVSA